MDESHEYKFKWKELSATSIRLDLYKLQKQANESMIL